MASVGCVHLSRRSAPPAYLKRENIRLDSESARSVFLVPPFMLRVARLGLQDPSMSIITFKLH
jgi:hypothetical protein